MVNDESPRPQVVVIAGPNGAGKTTCATALLPEDLNIRQYVNADTIASGLSAFAPETTAIEAGRVMLARLATLARQRNDFAFETTLASRSFAPFLRRIQGEGYLVRIIYVWLGSPDLAVQRVASRIQQGGHSVPAAVVRRRYWRGMANFAHLYRPLADTWVLCDNSGDGPVIVARGERAGAPVVSVPELYDEFQRTVSRAEHGE